MTRQWNDPRFMVSGALLAIGLWASACTGNGAGFNGESCIARSDCQPGLACINMVCVIDTFNVSMSARACNVVECRGNTDCDDNQACREDRCVTSCNNNDDCFGGVCSDSLCVDCINNDDCGDGYYCEANVCRSTCAGDGDCPAFSACSGGKCAASGCTSNRECIAWLKNTRAICNGYSRCSISCDTDIDCGSSYNSFTFHGCAGGECAYLGCETDEECKALLYPSGYPDSVLAIECRDLTAEETETGSLPGSSGAFGGGPGGGGFGSTNEAACQDAEDAYENLWCNTGSTIDLGCADAGDVDGCDFSDYYQCLEYGIYCDAWDNPAFPTGCTIDC